MCPTLSSRVRKSGFDINYWLSYRFHNVFLREIYSPWIVTLLVFDIPIKDSEKQRWK